ncbi:MAG: hypothetical protein ABI295_08235 [Xanthomarina sp.]
MDKPSFELGQITYYNWNEGYQSGLNLTIPVISNKNKVVFDSIYFRGYQAKIEQMNSEYTALIITESHLNKDLIMSSKSQKEYGNSPPFQKINSSFNLTTYECVVSYIENKSTKYLKLKNLIEKPKEEYPSSR